MLQRKTHKPPTTDNCVIIFLFAKFPLLPRLLKRLVYALKHKTSSPMSFIALMAELPFFKRAALSPNSCYYWGWRSCQTYTPRPTLKLSALSCVPVFSLWGSLWTGASSGEGTHHSEISFKARASIVSDFFPDFQSSLRRWKAPETKGLILWGLAMG